MIGEVGCAGSTPAQDAPLRIEGDWRDLGRDIALLHANVTECPDPNGYLENRDRLDDHEQLLADLHAGGYISRDARAWLDEVLTRLDRS